MILQKGIKKNTSHKKEFLGAHPIIQFFIEKLRIKEIISSCIVQDLRLSVPIENSLCVLIHNILTSPSPMYELSDWLSPLDSESLGLPEKHGDLINDYRMGNALDSFYNGKNKDVFFRLSLRAIKQFELSCDGIHQDTTSITMSGKYEDWSAKEVLTYGHNKDHRPDLKQVVLGMSVTSDGSIPLVHKVYNGNQTDDTLHVENYENLMKLLKNTDFIYTADSKLATETNLAKISSYEGRFISILPATWKEVSEFKKTVREKDVKWKLLLTRKNNRKPNSVIDRYQIARGEFKTSQGYCILWIKSSEKKINDEKTRERNILKCLEELTELQLKINKRNLKTKENINKTVSAILKKRNCLKIISIERNSKRKYKKNYSGKGRPKTIKESTLTWTNMHSISFQENLEEIKIAKRYDGVFPLVTNIVDDMTPKQILEKYKYQPFLEKRHSQLKTWQCLTPVLFKKDIRVIAYIHMSVMALMVSSLIERSLRIAMHKNNITDLPMYPDDKKCEYPTLYGIVRLFRNVERYEINISGEKIYFPAKINKIQKKVLSLLEIPDSSYQ